MLDADQFSEVVLAQSTASNTLVQAYVRRRSSDAARYGCHYNGDPRQSQWEIKYDGVPTAETRILAQNAGIAAPVADDVVRLEVRGGNPVNVTCLLNGGTIMTAQDATPERINTNGPPGFVARWAGGTTGTPVVASWSGGSL